MGAATGHLLGLAAGADVGDDVILATALPDGRDEINIFAVGLDVGVA